MTPEKFERLARLCGRVRQFELALVMHRATPLDGIGPAVASEHARVHAHRIIEVDIMEQLARAMREFEQA
jgi:hypothetical protein